MSTPRVYRIGAALTPFAALCENGPMAVDRLVELITQESIAQRVAELGLELAADFPDGPDSAPLWLVGALKGSFYFLADLSRAIPRDVAIGFVRASSYRDGFESSGRVEVRSELDGLPAGADIVLVEDVIDSGRTVQAILDRLTALRPRSLKVVTLLDKPARRIVPVPIDYRGFEIPDRFVVGYGMDYAERYRNLPDIRYLDEARDAG